jgi:hypothetical protein
MMCPVALARCRHPRTPRTRASLLAAVAVVVLGGGCAGRNTVVGGYEGARAVGDVLLLPSNIVVPVPPGLEGATPIVDEEIRSYLDSHGKRVQALTSEEAQAEWLASARALKAEVGEAKMSFEGAAATLARRMHTERRFDALVVPWISLRPARVRGVSVSWDGVTRTLRVLNPQGRGLQVLKNLDTQATAPSLELAVFSPDGRKLFEGVGGLDLLHALVIEGEPTRIDAELLPRSQIFAERSSLEEGIAVAFDPFLPRP